MKGDPTDITGIAGLVNKNYLNPNVDVAELEKKIIGNDFRLIKKKNPEEEYNQRMKKINQRIRSNSHSSSDSSNSDDSSNNSSDSDSSDSNSSDSDSSSSDSDSSSSSDRGKTAVPVSGKYKPMDSFPSDSVTPLPKLQYNSRPATQPTLQPASQFTAQPISQPVSQFASQPISQINYIDHAASTYSPQNSDFMSREDEEEKKCLMLDDIDHLRTELQDEDNIDLSRIPEVTSDSSFSEVEKVLKTLRRKYDRLRNNTFGNEIIIAAAQALEFVFDGERQFGKYRAPDLTGWHNTIRVKLRRMKYETSTITSETMDKLNVGPLGRLLMELGPSAFLHSKMKSDQHGKKTYTRDQMAKAHEDLREFED